MLRSIGEQSRDSVESVLKKKKGFTPGIKEWKGDEGREWWVNGTDGGKTGLVNLVRFSLIVISNLLLSW